MEPLFRALYTLRPSFKIKKIDIVTDRINIQTLLSFINPSLQEYKLKPFTMKVELVKNMAIFCRAEMEIETPPVIKPNQAIGFGHEFKNLYTTNQVEGSTGHSRIASYELGGLNLMIRSETDGYINFNSKAQERAKDRFIPTVDTSSLCRTPNTSGPVSVESDLSIKLRGSGIPLRSILDIKTRAYPETIDLREVLPQMWASQTPNLVRAYPNNGIVWPPKIENVEADIRKWEQDNQEDVKSLVLLLKRIVEITKVVGVSSIVKYNDSKDKLEFWTNDDERKLLPNDLYARWHGLYRGPSLHIREKWCVIF